MEAPEIKLGVKVHTTDEINKLFLPGEVGAVLDWEVRDTITGELFEKKTKKAESFTRQFFDLLLLKFIGYSPWYQLPVKDITNVSRYVLNSNSIFSCGAVAGVVTNGIIVGLNTGDPAATINDYVMTTPCGHDAGGHGANTFQYGGVTFGAPAADTTTSQFTITRNFANATAGTILVKEIGLYVLGLVVSPYYSSYNAGTNYNFMTLHDIIPGGINVLTGQTLTVNYRPQSVI